jgi:UDP-N-acetylmuramyl pentapeptide phosphotransferase/UDP-N-acetylglucosamine-1-phosphate transferase
MMATLMAVGAAAIALAMSAWLTGRLCDPSLRFQVVDVPNERSLHVRPTPRSGGVAMLAGILAGSAAFALGTTGSGLFPWLLVSALPVATIAFLDDRKGVAVAPRFLVHLVAAGLLVWGGGLTASCGLLPGVDAPASSLISGALAFLFVVWMVNLFNFMDGMDGFAGGMSVIGFGTLAALAAVAGHGALAAVSLVVAGAAAGFLLYNFPPARIFMGDTGSSTLGLLAAAFTLWGAREGAFPFWVGILVFSPFIVDASVTLMRRLLRGERVWHPHKTHYYQRLVQAGWGHRKTVVTEYGLMLSCAVSAVPATRMGIKAQWLLMALWITVYGTLMVGVSAVERQAGRCDHCVR